MTTLHMDVPQVQTTRSKIQETHDNMTQLLSDVANTVNQTVGGPWVGNSATEFQGEFESLRGQVTTTLEQMQELANRLQSEIAQWEDMAARLG